MMLLRIRHHTISFNLAKVISMLVTQLKTKVWAFQVYTQITNSIACEQTLRVKNDAFLFVTCIQRYCKPIR